MKFLCRPHGLLGPLFEPVDIENCIVTRIDGRDQAEILGWVENKEGKMFVVIKDGVEGVWYMLHY